MHSASETHVRRFCQFLKDVERRPKQFALYVERKRAEERFRMADSTEQSCTDVPQAARAALSRASEATGMKGHCIEEEILLQALFDEEIADRVRERSSSKASSHGRSPKSDALQRSPASADTGTPLTRRGQWDFQKAQSEGEQTYLRAAAFLAPRAPQGTWAYTATYDTAQVTNDTAEAAVPKEEIFNGYIGECFFGERGDDNSIGHYSDIGGHKTARAVDEAIDHHSHHIGGTCSTSQACPQATYTASTAPSHAIFSSSGC
ncbi:hypothetical protein AK812_SmicGene35676 [Symbiodinium microadriaticum]|uniref:Uncharacterized protein n=1 Tax=Symbiodinium microadriaticum TaxID=2951 RepID=A0A1Q9CKV3_SYMMI|nr:hypothetical protein AK812_SmicGene35676 [Symbiodinium microadriaticum]